MKILNADRVIELIKPMRDTLPDEKDRQAVRFALTVLEEESKHGEWISVDKDLPPYDKEKAEEYYEVNDEYPSFLVVLMYGVIPTIMQFDGEDWYDKDGTVYKVLYWMELPDVPKKGAKA